MLHDLTICSDEVGGGNETNRMMWLEGHTVTRDPDLQSGMRWYRACIQLCCAGRVGGIGTARMCKIQHNKLDACCVRDLAGAWRRWQGGRWLLVVVAWGGAGGAALGERGLEHRVDCVAGAILVLDDLDCDRSVIPQALVDLQAHSRLSSLSRSVQLLCASGSAGLSKR